MIESDGAVDLGAGQIEGFGDQRNGYLRHAAEHVLQSMQDWQGGPWQIPVLRDDFACALIAPWFVSWHAQPLL
jgi:hypothetical protein